MRKVLSGILSLAVVFAFLSAFQTQPLTLYASTDSQIADCRQQVRDIDKQLNSLSNQLNNIKQSQNQTVQEKTLLENDLQLTNEKLVALNSVLSELETELAAKKAQLDQTQANLDKSIEQFRKRARASYEAGQVSYLSIFLTATSMEDMLVKYDLMTDVAEYDKNLINDVKNQYNTIKELYDEINAKTQEQAAAVEAVASTQRAQQDKMARYNNLISSYDAQSASIQKQSESLHAKQDAIDLQLTKLYLQKAAEEAAKRQQNNNNSTYVPNYNGSGLCWPVPASGNITSGFGYRTYDGSYHKAIDIGAPMGTPVVAAADGVAFIVGWSVYGGGNQIQISHGSGIVTHYNHLSGYAVSKDAIVKKGQVIGYVGSTGNSSGPHLDFKVVVNGVYQNPLNYVRYGN